jgi:hypothetical protein
MLFAIIDCLKYYYHKDHYSFKEIENDGGMLATKENIPYPETIKPFSILFYHPFGSFISWLIMYYDGGVWSHMAGFIRNGCLTDQTIPCGIEHPFSDYLDGNGYVKIVTPTYYISEEQINELEKQSKRDVGKGYNYPGVINIFFQIVLGFRDGYKIRFSLDFLILSVLLIELLKLLKFNYHLIVIITLIYIIIVAFNIVRNYCSGKAPKL